MATERSWETGDKWGVRLYVPTGKNLSQELETRIRKDTDLIKRARDDAEQDLPSSSAADLSDTEKRICGDCAEGIEKLLIKLDDDRAAYERGLREQDPTVEDLDLPAQIRLAKTKIDDAYNAARHEWSDLATAARRALRSLKRFKRDNNINQNQSARYPESRIFSIGVLLVLIILEGIGNSWLFARGLSGGLFQGMLAAMTVSGVNVLLAFTAGVLVVRNFHHVSPLRRVLAGAGMAVYVLVALSGNLLVAHYRTMLELDPEHAAISAWTSFIDNPFDLASFESALLFLLGLLFALVACVDGYRVFDDPYPGFGEQQRRYDVLETAFREKQRATVEVVTKLRDEIVTSFGRKTKDAEKKVDTCCAILDNLEALEHDLAASTSQVEAVCQNLLSTYRSENREIRLSPPPKYFAEFPNVHTLMARGNGRTINGFSRKIGELPERKKQLRGAFTAYCDGKAGAVDAILAHAEKRLSDMQTELLTAEQEAAARLDREMSEE